MVELSGRAEEAGRVWAGVWTGGELETSGSTGPERQARQQGSPPRGCPSGDSKE